MTEKNSIESDFVLTRESLIEVSQGGWLYLLKLFPELKKALRSDRKCENIINHIRGEQNASLSCYKKGGMWRLYDHGDPSFSGDMFDIFKILNQTTSFSGVVEDLYAFTFGRRLKCKFESSKFKSATLPVGESFQVETFGYEELTDNQKQWLKIHKISLEVMKKNRAFFLKSYTFRAKSGKICRFNTHDDIVLGFKMYKGYKVYKPNATEFKVIYIGEKNEHYFFGEQSLNLAIEEGENLENRHSKQIFLCAGEKDTMILQSRNLTAFCLSSETASFFPVELQMILGILPNYYDLEIIVVYDNDETGIKQAQLRVEEQRGLQDNWRAIEWPQHIFNEGKKDVADLVVSGFPEEELIRILTGKEKFDSPVSPISPQVTNCVEVETQNETLNKELDINSVKNSEEYPGEMEDFPLRIDLRIEDLPKFLQELAKPFNREFSEMMIIAFITVFGAVFRKVSGRFRNDKLYTNLFTAIIGNPASGKGLLKWANRVVRDIDYMLIRQSRRKMAEYEERLELYKRGEIKFHEVGEKPKLETFSISADITPPMFILQLFENGGTGFVFDTEMDTMVESAKGSDTTISPLLRKAYEGEPITLMRKTNREHLIVPEGQLSMLMSGTPRQFFRLIPDTENGLFSRIIPYILHSDLGWKDALDIDEFDYEGYFADHAQKLFEYFVELESYEDPIVFELSKKQLEKFDKHFRLRLQQAKGTAGLDVRATVIRLGAITVKIAIIMSTLRKLDSQEELSNSNLVSDIDLDLAFSISDIVLNNVMETLKMMKTGQIEDCFRGKKLEYFYELDDEFTFSESQKIAEDSGIKVRTAQKWIYQFRDQGFLLNPTKGHFKKII